MQTEINIKNKLGQSSMGFRFFENLNLNLLSIFKVFISRLKISFKLISDHKIDIVWKSVKTRLFSSTISVGTKRDLNIQMKGPRCLVKYSLRLFEDTDINALNESYRHIRLVKANIPYCYVAVTKDNLPIYRQWLIGSSGNNKISSYFGDLYPKLKKNEALIEGAFTHASYRGLGIMPAAMFQIAEKGKLVGVDKVITFVDLKNILSLRSGAAAGFRPYTLRKERWIFFIRKVSFSSIPKDTYALYDKLTTGIKISELIKQ